MIPKNARIAYQGDIFRVYEWEQKLFDGKIKTFEAVKPKESVQVFVIEGDELIYVQEQQPHIKPYLGLAGGLCADWDEDPLVAAQREVVEELGITGSFRELFSLKRDGKLYLATHYYVCNVEKYTNTSLDPGGEKISAQRIRLTDMLTLMRKKEFRNQDVRHYVEDIQREGRFEEFLTTLKKE